MNLILCGMMGSGKTTVGVKIAELTDRRWYDTDALIVEQYGNISDIFTRYGEGYFRELETNVVKKLAEQDDLVISTGGGLVLKQENNDLLQKTGKIIFLRASIGTLLGRLQADNTRPLLQGLGESLQERLERLMAERGPIYERVADYVVDVDDQTPEELARKIVALTGCEKIKGR